MVGVSKSTISRYLNGGYVSDETKKKIDKAIKDTNYVPNNFAQSLKAKKNNLIGIVIPRLDSYATSRTLAGIDEKLRESGYQLIIYCTYQSREREIQGIRKLENQGVSGIILIIENLTQKHRDVLAKSKIPSILIGQKDREINYVIHDDEKAGYEAAAFIISNGHTNISYVEEKKHDVSAWIRRKNGFQICLNEHKIKNQNFWSIDTEKKNIAEIVNGIINIKSSAVVCATDRIAIEILREVQKRNIKVPEKVSIMGIGDYEISRLITPELTTIHYPYKSCGRIVAEKIINLAEGNKIKKETIISVKLIIRETVDRIKR